MALSTAIANAALSGNTDYIVDQINQNPSLLTDVDEAGRSLLSLAIIGDHLSLVKMLIKLGANPNQASGENDFTAMHRAAWYGRNELISFLQQHGGQIDSKSNSGVTPLYLALQRGNTLTARLLQKLGADINTKDSNGNSLLHIATISNALNLVVLLARLGADLNLKNKDGKSALDFAVTLTHYDIHDKLKNLIEFAAPKYHDNQNLLHQMITEDKEELISALISLGMNVNAKTAKGDTPLHFTVVNGNIKLTRVLLEAGAQVDEVNNNHCAPIHDAIKCYRDDMVQLLNEFDNQANFLGYRERRNLHFVFDNKELAQLLYATDHPNKYNQGGSHIEAVSLLTICWEKFTGIDKLFPEGKKIIANLLKNRVEKIINKSTSESPQLRVNESFLSSTGLDDHSVPFVLTRTDPENCELRLYDRGYLADKNYYDEKTKHYRGIRKITIPYNRTPMTLKLLHSTPQKTEEGVKLTLFNYIPQTLAGSEYILEDVKQKTYKGGTCFWSNHKTFILDQIIQLFLKKLPSNYTDSEKQAAITKAKLIYKKFDIFIHEFVLEKYKEFCSQHPDLEPNKEQIIQAFQKFIDEKYQKFNNHSSFAWAEYELNLEQFLEFKRKRNIVPGTEDDIFPNIEFPEDFSRPQQN